MCAQSWHALCLQLACSGHADHGTRGLAVRAPGTPRAPRPATLSATFTTLPARHLAIAVPRGSPESPRSSTVRPPRVPETPLWCTRALDPWLLPRDSASLLQPPTTPLCPLAPAPPSAPAIQSRSSAAVEPSRRSCCPEPQDKVRRCYSVHTASVKLAGALIPLSPSLHAIAACPGNRHP